MITFHSRQSDCARRARKNQNAGAFNFKSQIASSICTVIRTKRVKRDATNFTSRCSRTVLCYRLDRVQALPLSALGRKYDDVFWGQAARAVGIEGEILCISSWRSSRVNFHSNGLAICSYNDWKANRRSATWERSEKSLGVSTFLCPTEK